MKYLILIILLTGCSSTSPFDWDKVIDAVKECKDECPTCKPTECPSCPTCPEIPEVPTDPVEPPIKPKPPVFESKQLFKGGNLWKPVAEHGGNLVVLLKASNPDFDNCKVKLNDGSNYSLYQLAGYERTNGNRPTWRATKKCNAFKKVKVTCELGNKKAVISANSNQVCRRFE